MGKIIIWNFEIFLSVNSLCDRQSSVKKKNGSAWKTDQLIWRVSLADGVWAFACWINHKPARHCVMIVSPKITEIGQELALELEGFRRAKYNQIDKVGGFTSYIKAVFYHDRLMHLNHTCSKPAIPSSCLIRLNSCWLVNPKIWPLPGSIWHLWKLPLWERKIALIR